MFIGMTYVYTTHVAGPIQRNSQGMKEHEDTKAIDLPWCKIDFQTDHVFKIQSRPVSIQPSNYSHRNPDLSELILMILLQDWDWAHAGTKKSVQNLFVAKFDIVMISLKRLIAHNCL